MRITIYQSAVDRHYAEHGIIRLSAPAADQAAPSLSHIAALVIRFGMGFADVAGVDPPPASRGVKDRPRRAEK